MSGEKSEPDLLLRDIESRMILTSESSGEPTVMFSTQMEKHQLKL